MQLENIDFHETFITEGEPFYNDINSIDKFHFNKWVTENFVKLTTITRFKEVIPKKKEVKNLIAKGYNHKPSQCHYSAKAINLIDESYEYWTGFIIRKCWVYPIVTHSFSIKKNSIVDFARIDENFEELKAKIDSFPHVYYGIKIPNDFVKKYQVETFENFSMNPLLYDWFIEQHKLTPIPLNHENYTNL